MMILAVAVVVLLPIGLLCGSVRLSVPEVADALFSSDDEDVSRFIVLGTRLPALVTALLSGAALAVAGLMMQTMFNNPLAGPSIMGISTGASFGVALVVMLLSGAVGLFGNLAIVLGAFCGAVAVLGLLLFFSTFVRNSDALLIIGILIGYLASSAISLLNYFSESESVHSFVLWGLGTFSNVDAGRLPGYSAMIVVLIAVSFAYSKSLNVMLFGQDYAESAGVSTAKVRTGVLLIAGALTATVTAYCGPISFIGLIVPHVARMLISSSNHRILMPVTALVGALTGLLCQIASTLPSAWFTSILPVNAITPVLGVPVILYVIINRRRLSYFN